MDVAEGVGVWLCCVLDPASPPPPSPPPNFSPLSLCDGSSIGHALAKVFKRSISLGNSFQSFLFVYDSLSLSLSLSLLSLSFQMSPEHFESLSVLRKQSNYILKRKNLQKVKDLLLAYHETRGLPAALAQEIDVDGIAKRGEINELNKLGECLMSVAVSCDRRREMADVLLHQLPDAVAAHLRPLYDRQLASLPQSFTLAFSSPPSADSDSASSHPGSAAAPPSRRPEEAEEMHQRVDDLSREREVLYEENSKMRSQMVAMEKAQAQREAQMREMEERLAASAQQVPSDVLAQLSSLKVELEEKVRDNAVLQSMAKSLEDELAQKSSRIRTLETELSASSSSLASLRAIKDENDLLKEQIEKMRRESDKRARENSSDSAAALSELRTEKEALARQISSLQAGSFNIFDRNRFFLIAWFLIKQIYF
jgi:DNA repair exonuclease SbcCD ATPase subunit